MDTDIAIVNSGCLRANSVVSKGSFKLSLIAEILPIPENVVIKRMPGRILHQILENAVGGYPKYEGRFACVSGLKFKFDPEQEIGKRI